MYLDEKLTTIFSSIWSWWWQSNNQIDERARVVLTLSLGFITLSWFSWFLVIKSKTQLPPGPLGLPLLGNLLSLDPELHTYFASLARIHGPILRLWLGKKVGIVVTSPALAKEVLKDHDVTFANRDVTEAGREATYGGLDIAWSPNGPRWRMLRKVQAGSPVNVGEQMFLTIMNVITSMMWGGTVEGEESARLGTEFRQVVNEMTGLLGMPNVSDFYPSLARFDLQGIKKKMKGLALRFDRIFEKMIDQRMKMDGPIERTGMAERMFLFFLASLLHSFDWKLPQGVKLETEEKFGIVLKKKVPLVAVLTPRLSNAELYL
ncbi:hypothetical protein LguiB_028741 [Lonicera macranthoides]